MRCPSCDTGMAPIIIPHYSGVWLWECPRCGIRHDLRTGKESPGNAVQEHMQIAEQMRLLRQMHMDAKYAEERARRIQQLDDPRQVRQMLGVIAARMMRYLTVNIAPGLVLGAFYFFG